MRNIYTFFLLLFALNAFSTSYYVKYDATGANNGSDWANAFTDLQSALTASAYNDTIFVAAGTYKPHATDPTKYFTVKNGVRLIGGLAGNESPVTTAILNSRDFIANETILSGDLLGNDNSVILDTEPTRLDNSNNVLFLYNAALTNLTQVDGFTVSGGNAVSIYTDGAGVYIRSGVPTLRNLVIKNNSVFMTGGGVFIRDCNPTLENITIENNYSKSNGGGIYTRSCTNAATFNSIIVKNNKANSTGGGMYNYTSHPTINNGIFIGNIAEDNVSAWVYGGGIYNYSSSPLMKDIVIMNNKLIGTGIMNGAGMYSRGSVYQLTNATITKNVGGTVGTGLYNAFTSNPILVNVLIWSDNLANSSSTPTISYSLIQNSGGSSSWVSSLGTNGGNNIDSNPFLVADTTTGDVPLINGSPALGAGDGINGNNIGYYQGSGELSPSTIVITNGSLTDFGSVDVGSASAEQTFSVEGSDLFGDINIEAPAGFELSLTSNNYTGNTSLITLTQTGGVVATTPIYVRFKPNLVQSYNDSIKLYSVTADSSYINVTGIGTQPPAAITISAYNFDFGNVNAGQFSSEFNYQVSGVNLVDDIRVIAPSGFQITKISGDYSGNTDTLTFLQSLGVVANSDIFARFAPDTHMTYSGQIKNISAFADTQFVSLDGVGFYSETITVDYTSFDFGNIFVGANSNETYFTVQGTQLLDTLKIIAPAGFQITNISGDYTGNTDTLFYLPGAGGNISQQTIYIRFSPTIETSYSANLTISSGSALEQISLIGNGVVSTINITSSLSDFGNIQVGTSSLEKSFSIEGLFLTDDITITAPTGFEITTISGDYTGNTSSLILFQTNGVVISQTIYVRFSPTANTSYLDSLSISSTAVATQYLTVSGNGIFVPEITTESQGIVQEFGYVLVGTSSFEKSFKVYGSQLLNDIDITSATDFEISLTSGDYSGNTGAITLTQAGGIVDTTTIYVRFSPTTNASYNSWINLVSGSANAAVNVTGYGAQPAISTTGILNDFGNVPVGGNSSQQSFAINGIELIGDITVIAPADFDISLINNDFTANTDTLTISTPGSSNTPVYVRFSPTIATAYLDSIKIYSLETDTVFVTVSGTGENTPVVSLVGSISDFGNIIIGNYSSEQSYTVSGSNLTNDIVITAPTDFQITTISGDYTGNTSSVTLTQSGGTVSSTTIYVRFAPLTVQSYYANIINSSIGTTDEYITVSGNGVAPPRLFVKDDATGNNDGTSWADAFNDLQDALSASNSGDTIFVAKGVYTPHSSSRSISFVLKNNVKIYGGFNGNEYPINQAVLTNRDFILNETILSGDIYGNDNGFLNNSENSYHVLVCDASIYGNITSSTVLDGFTIRGGNANSATSSYSYGGGLYIKASSNDVASPVLTNLTFEYNSASFGGAIYNYAANTNAYCNFNLSNSYFKNNQLSEGTVNSGAAIYNDASIGEASPTITNVVFSNNTNLFTYSSYGGAVYNWASLGGKCNPVFKDVLFYANQVKYLGAAVYNRASSTIATVCKPKYINATFIENESSIGVEATMFNYEDGGTCVPELINVLMWDVNATEIENSGSTSANISYSLIRNSGGSTSWDNTLGNDGGNNLDSDPMFLDMINGDATLVDGSPALNTGNSIYGNNIGYYQQSGYIAPSITVTGTLNSFGTIDVGNSSTEQSFIVEGSNLQDDITIDAPAGFEITTTSGDYTGNTSSISLSPVSGNILATPIYVRFTPASAITYNGNISVASTNVTTQYVAVSGIGNTTQGIIVGYLSSYFGTVNIGGSSVEKSYFVKGVGLTSNITITSPAGFEISTTSGDYTGNTSSLTLTQTAGVVDSTIIYVRFVPTSVIMYSGNISHSSTGVSNVDLYVYGLGNIPPWIFVNDNATGNNDGTSWADAFNNLQDALNTAIYGDSIFVAAGTYIPDPTDRTGTFNLINGVKIFGGFEGNEQINQTIIDNRDFVINETILSGDLYGNDIGFMNNTENSYHVVSANAYANSTISSEAQLDGFTILGGNANDPTTNSIYKYGGGIFCRAGYNKSSSPTLKNLNFINNTASYGGAAYFDSYTTNGICSPNLYNVVFDNNTATYSGGAIYNYGSIGTCGTSINHAIFRNNSCTGYGSGGAIGNKALTNGTGGICNVSIQNALFYNNSSYYSGSAIRNYAGQTSGSYGGSINCTIINSSFVENTTTAISNVSEASGTVTSDLTNVILWNEGVSEFVSSGFTTADFQYCLVQGSGGSGASWDAVIGVDNGNNYDSNPEFVDMINGDVTLKSVSPALNTGNITYGNNIGYYQGAGVIIFGISQINDVEICLGELIPQLSMSVVDNNPDLVTFTIYSSDTTFVKEQNISITGSGDQRNVIIAATETTSGQTIISIVGQNNLNETDSISFIFAINEKPVVTAVNTISVDPNTSLYTIQVEPYDDVVYDYWLDGVNTGSFWISDVSSGSHIINISIGSCISDDFSINLPQYINDVPLEIVSISENYNIYCEGSPIDDILFTIRDDSMHHVNIDVTPYSIPDSAITITQQNDSMYVISLNSSFINSNYGAVTIIASNIFGEQVAKNINYEFKEIPVITNVFRIYNNSTYCINPEIEAQNSGYATYSIDNGNSWTNYYSSICNLGYGNYTMIAEIQGCYSDPYNFTLYQYVNNVNLTISSITPNYQAICGTNIPGDIIFKISDDTVQNVTVNISANSSYLESIYTVIKNNDSTYTISFNDTISAGYYYSVTVFAYNNFGESYSQTYAFELSNAPKPIINNITVDTIQDYFGTRYCFIIDIANVNNIYSSSVYFQGTNFYETRQFEDTICAFYADNYVIMAQSDGCYSNPFYVNLVGIEELVEAGFNIYPNPTEGKVFIEMPNNINDYIIKSYDITGRSVEVKSIANISKAELDFSNVQPGVYEIKILTDKNTYSTRVIVK